MDGFGLPCSWGLRDPHTHPSSLGMAGGGGSGFTPSATPGKESFMVRSENCFVRLFFFFFWTVYGGIFLLNAFAFQFAQGKKSIRVTVLFLCQKSLSSVWMSLTVHGPR